MTYFVVLTFRALQGERPQQPVNARMTTPPLRAVIQVIILLLASYGLADPID